MIKLGFILGAIYLSVIGYLVISSFSRWMFDEPAEDGLSQGQLLVARILLSMIWPLVMLSASGRRSLNLIMKGE